MTGPMAEAFWQVFGSGQVWLVMIAASVYGIVIGATPGLTATMAIALFVPTTFWLDPVPAVAAIIAMSACAIFAGDIPTALLRIPGTPASAAYADDAYRFAQRGQAGRVLAVALLCSVAGGLFGAVVLMLVGHQLARVATLFSVAEYFWLYLLGLTCALVVSHGSRLKSLLGLIVGLLLSTVGLSAVHTASRFTFGQPELYQGIAFIPAMIGLFGISQVFHNLSQWGQGGSAARAAAPPRAATSDRWRRWLADSALGGLIAALRLLRRRMGAALRSSSIGTVVGMLPGAGADLGAWASLAASRRLSKPSGNADDDSLAGIADATTANNASLAGSWIPTLVFGVPGDSITAIVIGVLMMKNLKPGPLIFSEQATLVYGLYFAFILANLILVPVGLAGIAAGTFLVRTPQRVLLPVILLFCIVGAYALNGSVFDVWVMAAMGVLGFVFDRRGVPLGPVVLGIILGGPLEERFVQSLAGAGGSLLPLVQRPLAAALAAVCLLLWATMIRQGLTSRGGRMSEPTLPT